MRNLNLTVILMCVCKITGGQDNGLRNGLFGGSVFVGLVLYSLLVLACCSIKQDRRSQ